MMDTYYKIISLFIVVLTSITVNAQHELTKEWKETFPMANEGTVYIDNKYGDITVNGWDNDSVKIIISIKATHRKKENAISLLDRIQPDAKTTKGLIKVTSEIKEKSKGFLSKYLDIANPFDFDKTNVQIDYKIFIPKTTNMTIKNKFGDIIIGGWFGNLEIDLQHGDVWINDDLKLAKINMRFGKLRCKTIETTEAIIKNGSITSEKLTNLKLESSGSILKIDSADSVDIISSKDDITINEIGIIDGEFKFSTIYIENLKKAMIMNLKLADLKVKKIENQAITIKTVQEKSDIRINIKNTSFLLTAFLEEGVLRLPKSIVNLKTKILDKSKKRREVNATYGTQALGTITIKGKEGQIILDD